MSMPESALGQSLAAILAAAPQPSMPMPPPQPMSGDDRYTLTEENKAKVLARYRDRMKAWSVGRDPIVRNAWRNILFKRGQQWIVWDRGRGMFRPVDAKQYSGPRPVWNRYASTMNAFVSTISRIEPTIIYRPATDEAEDMAASEVADRIGEVCDDECNTRIVRQVLAQWCGYTGGAWIETGYDPSPDHGMKLLQHDTCTGPECGATSPPTTSGMCARCDSPTIPAVDEVGEPIGHEVPVGKMYQDVATIFEMYFDAAQTDWKTGVREYVRKKSIDRTAAERRWGDVGKSVSADLATTPGDSYQDSLAMLPGYQPETGPGAGMLPNTRQQGRISESYLWAMPDNDFPEGLLAIILGGTQVVSLGPLPYRLDDDQPFLPTVYFPIDMMPGSLYSKTPADDLALVAVTRNKLVANMLMTMDRMAWPIWLMPEGSNVSQVTGTPGQVIRYNALGPNAAKPERVQGSGLPNGATTWLSYIDHELEELSAAYAGTKGDRAPGVSAGISLQMIEDRKNQRFGGMYILWEHGWAEVKRQQLAVFKQFATEPRLLKIQGRGSAWRVEQFMNADLKGKLDIVAEAGSAAPRSTLADRAELEQLASQGVINPREPEIQEKWLAAYGRSSWLPSMKADAETAAKQIEQFEALAADPKAVQVLDAILQQAAAMMQQQNQAVMQAQQAGMAAPAPLQPITYDQLVPLAAQQGIPLPRIRPQVDGHAIMARELGAWLKGDASQQLPMPIQAVVEMKHAEHRMIAQQQAIRDMQLAGGTFPTSGFLNNPGGQQSATEGPPSRMGGEMREQEAQAQ